MVSSHEIINKTGYRLYYPTNNMKGNIVNAHTGAAYDIQVRSHESLRLFKVIDVTGTVDCDGYIMSTDDSRFPNKDGNTLYYDSPEEYMFVMRNKTGENIQPEVRLWKNRTRIVFPNGQFSESGLAQWNQMTREKQFEDNN